MQLGVVFPQVDMGTDPAVIRAFARAIEGAGFSEAASISFWNSGRLSSVADALRSTYSVTTSIPLASQ